MGGFDVRQPHYVEEETPATMRRNARLGMFLFAIYLLLYGGFVLLNAFAADIMDRIVVAGLNLAIVYGMALILAALLLALIYAWGCRHAKPLAAGSASPERQA